ncbi:MAG: sugar ABC transporter substrate-binding protein [Limnochordia bacterium]|nr:sugar ABC transporter substrate-binding protein [Bacillota bacterium]
MKRLPILLMTVLLVAILAGQALAQDKVVTVALRSLPETDYIIEHLQEFTEATGIHVNIVTYPEEQLRQKTIMDLTTGAGAYDVIAVDSVFIPELAMGGYILPLDKYIDPAYDLEDIMESVRGLLSYEGQLYAAPIYQETTILMYRKDLFEQEGIAVPDTLDEFYAVAEHFTRPPSIWGVAMRGLRGNGMNIYTWAQWLHSYGGAFFDENMNPLFDSAESILATEKYASMLQKWGPPGSSSYSWDDVQTAFVSGRAAMIIDATNFYNRIEDPERSAIAGKIGYAVVPAGPSGRFPGNYAMGFAISAVAARSEEQRENAAKFVQWATSREMELGKALEADIVSITRTSVFESNEFRNKINPQWLEAAVKSLEITDPNYRPLIPEWREVGNLLGIAVESVISGQQSAPAALAEAQKGAEEVMARTR